MDVSVDSFYCPFLNILRCIVPFPFVIFHVYICLDIQLSLTCIVLQDSIV
jgi:hypothetical protein